VLAPLVVLEASLRAGLEHRAAHALVGLLLVAPLYWRRADPFRAFLASFTVAAMVPLGALLFGLAWRDLHSGAFILLLPYALFRWASGREALLGLGVVLGLYALTFLRGGFHGPSDAVGGAVVMLFPALLGAAVRFRARAHERDLEAVRLEERALIARELHDSVAHQLTAITLLAQGGLVVGERRPAEAVPVFRLVEESAAKALGELRAMVGALRAHGAPALGPQATLADLEALAAPRGHDPIAVTVDLGREGELEAVPAPLQAAVYRIAQEALTNTRRHAKNATCVNVSVRLTPAELTVTIEDDGGRGATAKDALGFGLVGMAERAALLGGKLEAGPAAERGWRVEATFPMPKRPR